MQGFIFRVCAYHGEPITIAGVPTRAGLSIDTPIVNVINDPNNEVVRDMSGEHEVESKYHIDRLVDDFESEYGCMVNIPEPVEKPGEATVFEFDVFEPSWPNDDEAKDVVDDLTERLRDWAEGFPSGR